MKYTIYNKGEPPLDSTTAIVVMVQQVVTLPPNTGVGFSGLEHSIQVSHATNILNLKNKKL